MLTIEPLRAVCLIAVACVIVAGCNNGPSVEGAVDRTFTVTGRTRLEISNPSGDVEITGSGDGKVHIHEDARATGMGFDKPKERLDEALANPGLEQRGDTIRIGKHMSNMRNLTIHYKIEVPHDTEISSTVVSGSQTIRDVRGPVNAQGASGSIKVEHVERDVQMSTASGLAEATDIGDDVHASSASGGVTISNAKGDIRANSLNGPTQIIKPGGRVDVDSANGSIDIQGANYDVKAHGVSGRITVQGDPGEHGYWDLKTVSGPVHVNVPANSNFRFSAEAISGEIRADIPIVIEEQGKHSLRAHVGNGGGRVEVHTVSGEIHVSGSK
ncbi:MAG: DUF4097 domain-containing protein [Acidobacteriota bacterium]|nr:DUF4097 domain-containing protein [Acidobacteriota bacterium]